MTPELQRTVDSVVEMKEKYFFDKFPTQKEAYKRFKKGVETYKYASEEHIETYHDEKTGIDVRMERPDYLLIDLLRQRAALRPYIVACQTSKKREDAVSERKRQEDKDSKAYEKLIRKMYADGLIDKESLDIHEASGFVRPKLENGY